MSSTETKSTIANYRYEQCGKEIQTKIKTIHLGYTWDWQLQLNRFYHLFTSCVDFHDVMHNARSLHWL